MVKTMLTLALLLGLNLSCNAPKKSVAGTAIAKKNTSDAQTGSKRRKATKAEKDAREVRLKDYKVPTAEDAMALAEQDAAQNGAQGVVYVLLSHIAEGEPSGELEQYRYGVTKMLNSLSVRPDIGLMEPLDEAESIYRVTLNDFSLSVGDWQTLMSEPGSAKNVTSRGNATIAAGDWLVFAASRPEIYNKIMRVPPLIGSMESQLNIDRSAAPVRVEVTRSEVTFGPRTLERYPINIGGAEGGYYWKSIDKLFGLTAGEFFFSLPNGLHAYMLSGFAEQMRVDARADVATDKNRNDGLTRCVGGVSHCGYVINGESCITCHASGININKNVDNARTSEAELLEDVMANDANRFAEALAAMNFDGDAEEPVLSTIKHYKESNNVSDRRSEGGEVPSNYAITGMLSR